MRVRRGKRRIRAARTLGGAVLLLLLLLPTACAQRAATPVTLRVDPDRRATGDSLRVFVANPGTRPIVFSVLCDLAMEGLIDTTWTTVYERDCSSIRVRPERLLAGDSLVSVIDLAAMRAGPDAAVTSCRLRLRFQFDPGNEGYQVVRTSPFPCVSR